MSHLSLRDATNADLPTVLAVLQAAFAEYRGRLDPPSGVHQETVESLRAQMTSACIVLALLDDTVVGCVLYRPENDHVYLGRLAVLPAYRNRGIATALTAAVEQRARARGIPRVRLGVRVALPHLRAWYERLGYRLLEERRHEGYVEPTYLLLEKMLEETSRPVGTELR
jgi:ribosomal protein S18 acetylase RimI-like enzyme